MSKTLDRSNSSWGVRRSKSRVRSPGSDTFPAGISTSRLEVISQSTFPRSPQANAGNLIRMRLFDEQTRELREVEIRPRMGVYVCGITPYDSAHLGHAFTYVHCDVLVRYLRHLGTDVVHVQNVTDVDDDMLRVSDERGGDFRKLAEREAASCERAMRAIGVAPPTHSPRATEFVPEMIEEVEALLAAGHGYERNGTVYFRVASDPGYGRLSGLAREQMFPLAHERGGHPEDPNKDDPLDFLLWQRSAPGEPWWESPGGSLPQ